MLHIFYFIFCDNLIHQPAQNLYFFSHTPHSIPKAPKKGANNNNKTTTVLALQMCNMRLVCLAIAYHITGVRGAYTKKREIQSMNLKLKK